MSVSRFLRGSILAQMHNFDAAFREFSEARRLSVQLADSQGIAFADQRVCEAQIELGQLAAARTHCDKSLDVVQETRALLARIDLQEGHAARALATLNEVLDHDGADIPPLRITPIYQLRARASAAVHDYAAAYADLSRYVQRVSAADDAERARSGVALRARFGADRAVERTTSLQRELAIAEEHSAHQKEQLRWTALMVLGGVLMITLLSYTLLANLRHRRQLLRLATEDALTGLPNRRRTVELATAAMSAAAARHQPLTFALIDLDHFKLINDRCGHAAGDQVLREFGARSRAALAATDVLGRWGGEEFLLIMPATPLDLALERVEALRAAALGIELPAAAADLRVSASAGLASAEATPNSLDEIVARADVALYEAKNQGRDLVRISDESFRKASTGIRRALRQR